MKKVLGQIIKLLNLFNYKDIYITFIVNYKKRLIRDFSVRFGYS